MDVDAFRHERSGHRREFRQDARRLAQNRAATIERRANPERFEEDRKAIRARNRALTKLGHLYPVAYEELVNAERAAEGLLPIGAKRAGKWVR